MSDNKLKNAAVLVFGASPQQFFLQSEVRCAKFKGTKAVKPFLDMKVVGGTLLRQIDECEKFVLDNIRKSAWVEPGKLEREEKWEYPLQAIREAITNAIAHRDYDSPASAHISIFEDRIEVWNPGKLPEPLKLEDLKRSHKSIPVNPLLANILFLVKYIEKWGTGTNDIVKWCLEEGLPEPIFKEESGGLCVVIRKFKTLEELDGLGLNERQKKAIEYVKKNKSISNKELQDITGVSRATASRELAALVKMELLKPTGTGKRNLRYSLA